MRAPRSFGSLIALLVIASLSLAGCLEEKKALTVDDAAAPAGAANVTQTLTIPKGTGMIGHRVCVMNAMGGTPSCYPGGLPMGAGGPAGSLSGTSNNPYTVPVN